MFKKLPDAVLIAHDYLKTCLQPGGVAVDTTVGNGRDTLYLARLVSPGGRVYGFDLQPRALQNTAELIARHGYTEAVRLFQAGHEELSAYVTEPVDAVIFNLGYLPGGDHQFITRPESTVKAVQESLRLLKPGGLVCLVGYLGHTGGDQERQALTVFLQGLDKKEFCAAGLEFLNRQQAPYLIIIERSSSFASGEDCS